MFEKITTSEDRGQVGIGTLIVFIAMVLVAAIAAGVLINTAGFLQAQAEATGEESSEQVSDRVDIVSVVGTANASEQKIEELNLSVRRSPGAGDIDLSNVIIEVFANGESATLTNGSADGEFEIINIQGDDDETLSSSDDRAELAFNLSADVADSAQLEPGDSVTVTVTTAAGGSAFVEKRAPSTVEAGNSYRL